MPGARETPQRIKRLTPLTGVLASVDRLAAPVSPREIELGGAANCILAEDVRVSGKRPATPFALRDGFAVKADVTADASSYAPARLPVLPTMLDVGARLPLGTDAVAAADAIEVQGDIASALAPVAAGDGILPTGADADPDKPLRLAGQPLRAVDLAALTVLDITRVNVRQPRVRLVPARTGDDAVLHAIVALLADQIRTSGGEAIVTQRTAAVALETIFEGGGDAIIVVGGSGSGLRDRSVRALEQAGRVEAHGIALMPGETTALGVTGTTPVLIVPGRLDAALAAWLVIGRRLLARLAGCVADDTVINAVLGQKIASPIGLVEVVPVRQTADGLVPLASGYLPLQSLTQADGYVLVPADSEGYPAGAMVGVRKWP
jgi:molybdopterin molybdotransferase